MLYFNKTKSGLIYGYIYGYGYQIQPIHTVNKIKFFFILAAEK